MKRQKYHGYIMDTDNLGRPYIYNIESSYAEENDHILVNIDSQKQTTQIRAIIDARVRTGMDCRAARIDPNTGEIRLR